MQDAQAVLRGHRERRADGDGLLAVAVVERAGHLALAVQVHRALLDAAHQQHVAQQGDAVVEREVLGYGGGVLRPLRPGGAHGHPGVVSLCGRGPGGIAARGPACRAAAGISAPYERASHWPCIVSVGRPDTVIYAGVEDGGTGLVDAAALAPAGRDDVAGVPARARRRHRAAARPADRRGHRARRLRRGPARVLLQPRGGRGRRAARRPVRAPPPAGAAAVVADDRAGTFLIAAVAARPAGRRPRPPPRRPGAGASVRPAGGGGPRVRPRPRADGVPGQRRADGHLEAGHRTCTARASRGRRRAGRSACSSTPGTIRRSSSATPTRARTPCSRGPTTRAGRRGRRPFAPERPTARARSAVPGSP